MVSSGMLAILESVTSGEVLILLVLALVVLGPERLPSAARSMGRWIAKARSMSSGLTSEIREVLDDPQLQPLREVGEFVASPRRKLLEYATEAENEAAEARRLAKKAAAAAEAAEAAAAAARANAEEAADLEDELVAEAHGDDAAHDDLGDEATPSDEPTPSDDGDVDADEEPGTAS